MPPCRIQTSCRQAPALERAGPGPGSQGDMIGHEIGDRLAVIGTAILPCRPGCRRVDDGNLVLLKRNFTRRTAASATLRERSTPSWDHSLCLWPTSRISYRVRERVIDLDMCAAEPWFGMQPQLRQMRPDARARSPQPFMAELRAPTRRDIAAGGRRPAPQVEILSAIRSAIRRNSSARRQSGLQRSIHPSAKRGPART